MTWSEADKPSITRELVDALSGQPEVRKIVIFGAFLSSPQPHDLDVAVFQDSQEHYYPLASRYRLLTRPISRRIPMDIVPLPHPRGRDFFVDEINKGRVVYER